MAVTAAYIVAAAVVASTAVNIQANKEAAEEQQKNQEAIAAEKRKASLRRRIREQRIQQARIEQQAANLGIGDSSGISGAKSSLASQFATASSGDFFAQMTNERLGDSQVKLANKQNLAAGIGAIGQVAGAGLNFNANKSPDLTTSNINPQFANNPPQ